MTSLKEIQLSLETQAKELVRLSEKIKEAAVTFDKATNVAIAKDFFEAETKVKELTRELNSLSENYKESEEARGRQQKQLSTIRENLNGKGRNPLVDHAFDVFQALKEANPTHHLVQRSSGNGSDRASLTKTEAMFIYACLELCADKMGNRGCNDWVIDNPESSTFLFAQSVERWTAEDSGEERRELDPKRIESTNFLVPEYLRHLLRRVYGEDIKTASLLSLGLE